MKNNQKIFETLAKEARKYKSASTFAREYAIKKFLSNELSPIEKYGKIKKGDIVEIVSGEDVFESPEKYRGIILGFTEEPKYPRGKEIVTIVLPEGKIDSILDTKKLRLYGKERNVKSVKVIGSIGSLEKFYREAKR